MIYWLYGSGGSQRDGAESFVPRIDRLVRQGRVPPAIVVLPNLLNDSWFVDSYDGKWPVERVFVDGLVPHIDQNYRTIPSASARAVDGFSMGGYGAAHLGFKYPDVFGVVSVFSGALVDYAGLDWSRSGKNARTEMFGDNKAYFDANDPVSLVRRNADRIRDHTLIQLGYSNNEGTYGATVQRFAAFLTNVGISHDLLDIAGGGHGLVPDGAHGTYLTAPDDRPFLFYAKAFGQRPPS